MIWYAMFSNDGNSTAAPFSECFMNCIISTRLRIAAIRCIYSNFFCHIWASYFSGVPLLDGLLISEMKEQRVITYVCLEQE